MMFRLEALVFVLMIFLLRTGCYGSLREVYRGDFLIGGLVGNLWVNHTYNFPIRKDRKEIDLLVREFNCITAENMMKWEYLQPYQGHFNFEQADQFVAFAEKNGMDVVGHSLVWHSQTPDWLFTDDDGQMVSREVLIERMREHIHTVVGRYRGRIKYWDVVNEAIDTHMVVDDTLPKDENGNPQKRRVAYMRDSPWRQIIGDDYIELAFKFAHEADPEARLLYNDYSMTQKAKAEFVGNMVRRLKAEGVPIHGVGMQGHWHLEYPSMEELQLAIDIYGGAGVKVSISELDVGVLPLAYNHQGADIGVRVELQEELDPYTEGVPQEVLAQQAEKYKAIFEVLLKNRDVVDRVTLWGVSDQYSWKNDNPVRGRTAYPLLFDRDFSPKPAYFALRDLKR